MPAKKAPRTESAATANESLVSWIAANDTLIHAKESITISKLFDNISDKTFRLHGVEHPIDWSEFRKAIQQRNASSPRWFLQLRKEDLLCDPDGLTGVTASCFVVVEASESTLAPAHFILKEHWPNSDLEDNAPERINFLEDQKLFWKPVTADDGSSINAFVLSREEVQLSFGAPPAAGSSGSVASPAVPISFGFGTPAAATATAAAPISFGFGTPAASAPAAAAPISFGFGAPAAAAPAAAPISFGFGAPAAPATQTSGFGFGSTAPAAAVKLVPVHDIVFVLWSKVRVKEMLKELKAGSRIVKEGAKIGDDGKTMKLVMQNDLKDNVESTARDIILNKLFAKDNADIRKVDQWLNDCPVYDDHLAPHLQKFRGKFVKEQAEGNRTFESLVSSYETTIVTELQRMVDERKRLVQKETEALENVSHLLKENKIADKSTFRVLKYYPANDDVKFRPFGKVSGISEAGEHADFCFPPMYVFKNKLLAA